MNIRNFIYCFVLMTLFTGCTIYTEKQSEALSRSVYATKDSFDNGRFDLTDEYATTNTRLVKPPKKKIEINPVFKEKEGNKNRIVIVPSKFKNDSVVVVGSSEYETLLKDKKISVQITKDLTNLANAKNAVEQELEKQIRYNNQMVIDLNKMQKQLVEKNLDLLKCKIIIVALISTFGVCVYLRIKGIL